MRSTEIEQLIRRPINSQYIQTYFCTLKPKNRKSADNSQKSVSHAVPAEPKQVKKVKQARQGKQEVADEPLTGDAIPAIPALPAPEISSCKDKICRGPGASADIQGTPGVSAPSAPTGSFAEEPKTEKETRPKETNACPVQSSPAAILPTRICGRPKYAEARELYTDADF